MNKKTPSKKSFYLEAVLQGDLNGTVEEILKTCKTIAKAKEDLEEDDFSLLMVRRLYGDSSTQLNTPSISMLGSHRFIELNSSTAKKYGINSEVGNFIQGSNSILINIDINEYLPDDLVVAAINRRGFENIDPCLGFDISEAKNREELNVN